MVRAKVNNNKLEDIIKDIDTTKDIINTQEEQNKEVNIKEDKKEVKENIKATKQLEHKDNKSTISLEDIMRKLNMIEDKINEIIESKSKKEEPREWKPRGDDRSDDKPRFSRPYGRSDDKPRFSRPYGRSDDKPRFSRPYRSTGNSYGRDRHDDRREER